MHALPLLPWRFGQLGEALLGTEHNAGGQGRCAKGESMDVSSKYWLTCRDGGTE